MFFNHLTAQYQLCLPWYCCFVVSKAQPLASTPEILALDQSPLGGFCGFIPVALVVADST